MGQTLFPCSTSRSKSKSDAAHNFSIVYPNMYDASPSHKSKSGGYPTSSSFSKYGTLGTYGTFGTFDTYGTFDT